MYLYVASSDYFKSKHAYKFGCTENPRDRRSTYLTGCPPGMGSDIDFVLLYKTPAKTKEELFHFEDELHDAFHKWRLVRSMPGDSEWFQFEESPVERIRQFMESKGWTPEPFEDLPWSKRFPTSYKRNFKIIKSESERFAVLDEIQSVEIAKIVAFVGGSELAATVIAPCGFGKTRITVKSIQDVARVVICCPTTLIQEQWVNALGKCVCVGGKGSTDMEWIRSVCQKPAFVIVALNASCDLLTAETYDLLVVDEAHHMAGVVDTENGNVGITRRIVQSAVEKKIKRLFLTYTPRYVSSEETHLSMDDEEIFGKIITKISFRYMVDRGLLPDYRVWCLRDGDHEGSGVMARAACILEAWKAEEMVRGKPRHILHHMLVYAATLDDAAVIETFFRANCAEQVLNIKKDDDTSAMIRDFTAAKRAILISVQKLNEGADLPISNAVAFACVKRAIGQTTQFMLRPGRWYKDKDVFHILIPTLGEDMTGFETVLSALAQSDDEIRDEIIARSAGGSASKSRSTGWVDVMPHHIIIENYESSPTDMTRCFSNIHREGVRAGWINVQKLCAKHGIKTSVAYAEWKLDNYPPDPRPKNMTWFKFLNPEKETIRFEEFAGWLVANGFDDVKKYEAGRDTTHPSAQEILDGYFGEKNCDFTIIYGTVASRRR